MKPDPRTEVSSTCGVVVAGGGGISTSSPQRRNYSDADLQAALRQIRSGQLGTRKASIIYGVPRSTLRNKVYKLQANDRRLAAAASKHGGANGSGAADNVASTSDSDGDVEHGDVAGRFRGSPVVDWYGSSQLVMGPVVGSFPPPASSLSPNSFPKFPTMHSLFRGFEQPQRDHNGEGRAPGSDPCPSSSPSSVELSLKDVIARTVATRLAKPVDFDHHKAHQGEQEQNSPEARSSTFIRGQSSSTSRPKRGKYRNYDQENLLEAVKAVQRGEMSVHRAGTFYGVPHSTLEYKVKERHLMRPRKRPPKDQPVSSTVAKVAKVENSDEGVEKRRNNSGSSSSASSVTSESCSEPKQQPGVGEAASKRQSEEPGLVPNYFNPFAAYGLPPPYMFWNHQGGSRPPFPTFPPGTMSNFPPPPPPLIPCGNGGASTAPFFRWVSPQCASKLPWPSVDFSPTPTKQENEGSTYEEARKQWLKEKSEKVKPDEQESAKADEESDNEAETRLPSYKDDLRAAIVAMERAAENEDT